MLFHGIYKLCDFLSDGIFVHSIFAKKKLCHDYCVDPYKVWVVPYGVKCQKLENANNKSEKKPTTILTFGAISPRKGIDILIEAFSRLIKFHPEWRLIIVGSAPPYYRWYFSKLVQMVTKARISEKVSFLGTVSDEDLHRLISSADLVVFPYRYIFGASSALTFAIQHQKAIVISDLPFVKEILRNHVNAIIVRTNDVDSLIEGLESAMTDKKLKYTIEKNIINVAERCSWRKVAEITLKKYYRILNAN